MRYWGAPPTWGRRSRSSVCGDAGLGCEVALGAGRGGLDRTAVFGAGLSELFCAVCVERDGELPADEGGEHDPLGDAEVGVAADRDEEEAGDGRERPGEG